MYGPTDLRASAQAVYRSALVLAAVLTPLLAGYVLALVLGNYPLSVVAALLMAAWCIWAADLLLLPRLRYARFLKEMNAGLRRETLCTILRLEPEIRLQDGVRVRQLHVRLKDGDSRIFYLNASKVQLLPEPGSSCCLVSFGRHVMDFSVS